MKLCNHPKVTKIFNLEHRTLQTTICNTCGFKKTDMFVLQDFKRNLEIQKLLNMRPANNNKYFFR